MNERYLDRRTFLQVTGAAAAAWWFAACAPNPESPPETPNPTPTATPKRSITPTPPLLDDPNSIFMEVDRNKFWTPPVEEITWFPNWPQLHRGRFAAMRPLFFEGSARENEPKSWGPLQAIKEIYYRKEGKPLVPDPVEVALNEAKDRRDEARRKGESVASHGKCAYFQQERVYNERPVILEGQTFYDVPIGWETVMGMLIGVLFPFKAKFLVPPQPGLERGGKGISALHNNYWNTRNQRSRTAYVAEMNKESDGGVWYHLVVGIQKDAPADGNTQRWPLLRTNEIIDPNIPEVEDTSDRVAGLFLPFDNTNERWEPSAHHDLGLDDPKVRPLIMEIAYNRQRILHRHSKKSAQ